MQGPRPRIYLAYTGGTIGMRATSTGYCPMPGYLQEQLESIPRFQRPEVPEVVIEEFDPLLDSANMTPEHWHEIAAAIERNRASYDGFLVVHGTDTMAYTASALSFMLENLKKPVILTGSQIPLFEARTDAEENLLTSLLILGRFHQRLNEVFVFFDNKLMRGNRSTKVDASSFAAFDSPDLPPIARCGIDIEINWDLVRPPDELETGRHLTRKASWEGVVGTFRLFPGLQAAYIENLLLPPVQGVVLECYGSGNAPSKNEALMRALHQASERGVVLVAVTQAHRGSADLTQYATGRALADAGVVSGYDMTREAALTKLAYLFELGHSPEEVRRLVQQDLRGELSPPASAETPGRPRGTQRYRGL